MRCIWSCVITMMALSCWAQSSMNDIDLSRIPQKKIRKLITIQTENDVCHFSDIKSSYYYVNDLSDFNYMENIFTVNENTQKVWQKYLNNSPLYAWDGRILSFGVLISKFQESIMYNNDNYFTHIDTSQVFYINLKMVGGIYNLAVGMEVVDIDSVNYRITLSYIEGGKVRGIQTIDLISTDGSNTRIIHESTYKSNSRFRDRFLYPFFHERAITEFHRNVLEDLLLKEKPTHRKKNKKTVEPI